MTADELEAIATFYPFIFRKPVGSHIIFVCDSVTCWVMGCDGIRSTSRTGSASPWARPPRTGGSRSCPYRASGAAITRPSLMVDRELTETWTTDELERILDQYR